MSAPSSPRSRARHLLARASGVPGGAGCDCLLCGASPFDSVGPAARMLGIGFGDWDACEAPSAADLCAGCARLMAGRPGSTPRPLRDTTVAVVDGVLARPDRAEVWTLLLAPPSGLTVLSWAISKQRHHTLHAGLSSPTRLLVGSDTGTVVVRPLSDAPLVAAVLALRAGPEPAKPWCTRDDVLSGQYRVTTIARNPARWAALEAVVAPRRGDPAFALYVAHAPVLPETPEAPLTLESMPDPTDTQAIALLSAIAQSSGYRSSHGLEFWNAIFARRIQRYLARPLPDFVARLFADLQVPPASDGAAATLALLATYDDTTERAIRARLRERTAVLIAGAFIAMRDQRAARPSSTTGARS